MDDLFERSKDFTRKMPCSVTDGPQPDMDWRDLRPNEGNCVACGQTFDRSDLAILKDGPTCWECVPREVRAALESRVNSYSDQILLAACVDVNPRAIVEYVIDTYKSHMREQAISTLLDLCELCARAGAQMALTEKK